MFVLKVLTSLLLITLTIGCNCVDCSTAQLNDGDLKFLSPEVSFSYSDGVDTFTTELNREWSQPDDKECGGMRPRASLCLTRATTDVLLRKRDGYERALQGYGVFKSDTGAISYVEVCGLRFAVDNNLLYSVDQNSQIENVNYVFDQQNYTVQKITNTSGAPQIEEMFYHPDLGFLEFTFKDPVKTYKRVP